MKELRIKLSLRANQKKFNTKIACNWKHLLNNEIYKTNLALHSGTAVTYFKMKTLTKSANNAYQKFVKAHKETAEMLIPQKEKVKNKSAMGKRNYNRKKKTTKNEK